MSLEAAETLEPIRSPYGCAPMSPRLPARGRRAERLQKPRRLYVSSGSPNSAPTSRSTLLMEHSAWPRPRFATP